MNKEHIEELPKLIQKLYEIVADLHSKFPNWMWVRGCGDVHKIIS
jgi:hypothetical protein